MTLGFQTPTMLAQIDDVALMSSSTSRFSCFCEQMKKRCTTGDKYIVKTVKGTIRLKILSKKMSIF